MLFFLISAVSKAQPDFSISGIIYDSLSRAPLPAAVVYPEGAAGGVSANLEGMYRLPLPRGKYVLVFSLIGYEKIKRQITLESDIKLNIPLMPVTSEMDEIVISGRHADENIRDTQTGRITLGKDDLEKLPYLLGEADPIRILQLMPGIQTAAEGNTGFMFAEERLIKISSYSITLSSITQVIFLVSFPYSTEVS